MDEKCSLFLCKTAGISIARPIIIIAEYWLFLLSVSTSEAHPQVPRHDPVSLNPGDEWVEPVEH